MQLVDKKDHVLGTSDFVHHRFDALFELAAIFCARDHQGEIERDDALVPQQLGNIPARNFLRQAFGDRGLANAGLADEHRIIFRAPAEHLNHALDFVATSNHRIKLAFLGQLGQVTAERAQRRSFDVLLRSRFSTFFCF